MSPEMNRLDTEADAFREWVKRVNLPLRNGREGDLALHAFSAGMLAAAQQQQAEPDAFNRILRRQLEQEWAEVQLLKASLQDPVSEVTGRTVDDKGFVIHTISPLAVDLPVGAKLYAKP